MENFRNKFEKKADELSSFPDKSQWEDSVPGMIRREIALTVDQIKRLKIQHDEQFLQLLRLECYIDTDLMQMEHRNLQRYTSLHSSEKQTLKQRLFDIEKERRDLSLKLEEKTQSLEERLLSLINKHEQING